MEPERHRSLVARRRRRHELFEDVQARLDVRKVVVVAEDPAIAAGEGEERPFGVLVRVAVGSCEGEEAVAEGVHATSARSRARFDGTRVHARVATTPGHNFEALGLIPSCSGV
jgi:hypothetical protein